MPDTMELVRTAVRDEAVKRGLADPTFAELADLTKVAVGEDGQPNTSDVLEAVSSLRKTKPHLFKSATQLTDDEFRDLTDTLRERRSMHPQKMPDGLKRVNAFEMRQRTNSDRFMRSLSASPPGTTNPSSKKWPRVRGLC